MSLKNQEFMNLKRKNVNRTSSSNDNNLLFPKRPNKRYQVFISKEKRKYDDNWENKLKDQNLTDQNFFLNYYSYGKNRENSISPLNIPNKPEKESYFLSSNQLNFRTPTKNVHLIRNQANSKSRIEPTIDTKEDDEPYENPSINDDNVSINESSSNNKSIESQDLNDSVSINEMNDVKGNEKAETLHRSFNSTNEIFQTPSKKKARSAFSKSLNLELPPKENFDDFDNFINFDNITQFAQFPKRFSKTRQEERKKVERKNFCQSQQIMTSLPEISIPSRKEVLSLKSKTPNRMITSNSVQSEKFPTIKKRIKLPCKVLSATLTRFDLQ